jgi:hypothetical protein
MRSVLYGWKCLLIMDPGIRAALATGAVAYIGYLVPLDPVASRAVAIGLIVSLPRFTFSASGRARAS